MERVELAESNVLEISPARVRELPTTVFVLKPPAKERQPAGPARRPDQAAIGAFAVNKW